MAKQAASVKKALTFTGALPTFACKGLVNVEWMARGMLQNDAECYARDRARFERDFDPNFDRWMEKMAERDEPFAAFEREQDAPALEAYGL